MTKKLCFCLIAFSLLAIAIIFENQPPKLNIVEMSPLPTEQTTLLLPLDGRPPCTKFVSDLGLLASVKIILPPKELLGNYTEPAPRNVLYNWLNNNMENADSAIISSDLLIHGGLVGSRMPVGTFDDENNFLKYLEDLRKNNLDKSLYIYSIIPRLLIADQLIPDSWWQWHLMRWAALQDIQDTFGDPLSFKELQRFKAEIPPEIIAKYTSLYRNNNKFNHRLLDSSVGNNIDMLIIGQDDGQPFGLPNLNRNRALFSLEHNGLLNKYHTTRGADELSCLILAAERNRQWQYSPKIFVEYSSPRVADITMPFMPCSVGETVNEKIAIIGGQQVYDQLNADFILYVHCGNDETVNLEEKADRVKKLITGETPVALVDLSANYDIKETLFPHLINNNTPLVRLAAFAGWNTVSNSVGTAVAQASIFTGQKQRLSEKEIPSLYALNLQFNLERFFDDWAYQKAIHYKLAKLLEIREMDPYALDYNTFKVSQFIKKELDVYKNTLFYDNLCRYPFYSDKEKDYYLSSVDINIALPWERIFEVELSTKVTFGTRSRAYQTKS
ncbi:MAG: DUF4127 family protein [Acidaminococcaceae bacterium]